MIRIELPEDFGDEIVQALVRIEGQLNTASRGVINEALLAIETRAKGYSPVDTGRLRSSIHAVAVGKGESGYTYSDERGNSYNGALDVARSNEGSDIGMVGTNVEYAAEQEFGNGERRGHKYLTKATLEIQPMLINKLKEMKIK
jgi:hypothetical protein